MVWSLCPLIFSLCTVPLVDSLKYPFPRYPKARDNLTAVVLVADGSEELEAVSVVELLRRAGIRTTVAGVAGADPVTCKYGMVLTPDCSLAEALTRGLYDAVVIPGGEEAANYMSQSEEVGQLLLNHEKEECYFGALSAGPLVLNAHNIKYLCRLTSAPEYMEKLHTHYSYYSHEDTIVDVSARVVTGRYPGRAFEFVLSLINHVADLETANKVSYDILPYTMV
ncbi:Parkinson disease protein 7 homolog [Macrosteles quadrilineatus]|uniref:Parkinson disease protein 7 homolog n=1 Tax=Macrosteles quadrilineatus TaxID=74068 RepID=UPI0023E22017|nr:Parkinson disease protein 7 homolog [Macrosteles quadrilineatus]XP_054269939.1 Parkinson disease protein 7 homolog [Macrosteles quadrilineatus]